MYDICCIGHLTHDKIVTPHHTIHMAGGTSFYFSHAIRNMPVNYHLVTALAKEDMDFAHALKEAGTDITVLLSKHTVYFENIYGTNSDDRKQRVLHTADPFVTGDIKNIDARFFHLGPLLANDIPLIMIQYLASKGNVSLDVQGYLRSVINEEVVAIDWKDQLEALPYITILKANEAEAEKLTGKTDCREAAMILAKHGVKEVVITLGSKGSVIFADNIFYEIPAITPVATVDATGCGDTYMAGYLSQRLQNKTITEAGLYGAAMASIKIAASGPFTGTEAAIHSLLQSV